MADPIQNALSAKTDPEVLRALMAAARRIMLPTELFEQRLSFIRGQCGCTTEQAIAAVTLQDCGSHHLERLAALADEVAYQTRRGNEFWALACAYRIRIEHPDVTQEEALLAVKRSIASPELADQIQVEEARLRAEWAAMRAGARS